MSLPPFELTDTAISQLEEIALYSIEKWGKQTAEQYLIDLEAAAHRVSLDPNWLPARYRNLQDTRLCLVSAREHFLVCHFRRKKPMLILAIVSKRQRTELLVSYYARMFKTLIER